MLDTPATGLSKAQVMEIYGRVTASTTELTAIEAELAAIRIGATDPVSTPAPDGAL